MSVYASHYLYSYRSDHLSVQNVAVEEEPNHWGHTHEEEKKRKLNASADSGTYIVSYLKCVVV